MAQAGFTPISLYFSSTAAAVPTAGNLANGELALNIADMKLYAKNSAGTVTLLASSGGASGTVSSVAVSGGTTGLTTSGGPITTSGTITLAGTLATTNGGTNLTSFTSGGVVYASSSSALATGSALTFDGTNLTLANSSGVTSNLTTNQAAGSIGSPLNLDLNFKGYLNTINARIRSWDEASSTGYGYLTFWTSDGTTLAERYRITQNGTAIWNVAGSEQMRLTSTGLGIGTSSPAAKLDVTGVVRVNNSAADTKLWLDAAGGYNNFIYYREQTVADRGVIGFAAGSGNLQFRMGAYDMSSGTQSMTLTSAGNLGLGVTPSAWDTALGSRAIQFTGGSVFNYRDTNLILTQNAYFDGAFKYYASSIAAGYYDMGSGTHKWFIAPSGTAGNAISFTQAMTLDASGNLGVGTTAPGTRIDVVGAIRATSASDPLIAISSSVGSSFFTYANADTNLSFNSNGTINLRNTNSTTNNFVAIDTYDASNNIVTRIATVITDQTNHSGALAFVTRNAGSYGERARIDSSGNLLVGGTAARGTTLGSAHLDLFNGTAPAGTLTNGVSLYSSSGDLKFMNAAGDAFDVGYRNIPQNAQTGNYTLTLADSGDHIYHAVGAGAATYTIPANSSVAYPIGTAITFINMAVANVTIAITTDTMYLSSAGTTGSRTLAQYGSATAIKITSTNWLISGSGLT